MSVRIKLKSRIDIEGGRRGNGGRKGEETGERE